MASPSGTLSSCSTQRGHWNGREHDAIRSRCQSLTPARRIRRASSRSTCASGGSTESGRRAGETKNVRHHENPSLDMNDCSTMRVGVRVRPAFSSEVLPGYRPAVTISIGASVQPEVGRSGRQCLDEEDGLIGNKFNEEARGKQACVELRLSNWRQRRFPFDYAFDATCQQDEIYRRSVFHELLS